MIAGRRARSTTLLVAALVIALAGCTSEAEPDPGGGGSEQEAFPLVAFEQADADDVAEGGTLTLATALSPTEAGSWNPLHADAQLPDIQFLLSPTLGSLIEMDAAGEWHTNTDYAVDVAVTTGSRLTVDVALNPRVRWPDGSAVTAEDYRATFGAVAGAGQGFEVVPGAPAARVEVRSDHAFSLVFEDPGAHWQTLLMTSPLPAEAASSPESFNAAFRAEPAPSIGPFEFALIDEADGRYSLRPSPLWWGDAPRLDTVVFEEVSLGDRADAFAAGYLDLVEVTSADELSRAEARDGSSEQRAAPRSGMFITLNARSSPTDDRAVRRAVALTLDREVIARLLTEPLGLPTGALGDWVRMPGEAEYRDSFGALIGRSIPLARQNLTEAGWSQGPDGWTRGGVALSLSFLVPEGDWIARATARGTQDSLSALGVAVEIEEEPTVEYLERVRAGEFELAALVCGDVTLTLLSAEPCYTPADSPLNASGISDTRLAPLWASARADVDGDQRATAVSEINAVLAEEVPSIPLVPRPNVVLVADRLVNLGAAPLAAVDWSSVGYRD